MLFFEIEVAFTSNGHKVNVSMRHLKTNNGHSDAFARDGLFDGLGDMLGEHHHLTEFFVIKMEDVIGFMFGDHEGMAFRQRVDIEESKETIVLGNFVARDFTVDDSGKNGCHGRMLLAGDFEDFEDHFTGRDCDFSHFTDFFTEEPLANGRIDRKFS